MRTVRTLFSCLIRPMYNKVNRVQKQRLMLNSYLPGINTSIFPKRHYNSIFYEKLVNELHAWIESLPHVIDSFNFLYPSFVKINANIVNKQKHLLQISVRDLHNNMILQIFQRRSFCSRTVNENYVLEIRHLGSTCQKHIKPISNRN